MRLPTKIFALCGLLIAALLLRIWAIDYDLPYIYHPDEPVNIIVTHRILSSSDLNPHFFGYPSLLYYINCVAYYLYSFVGHLTGLLQPQVLMPLTMVDMGVTRSPQPDLVLLARVITAFFGAGTVALTYVLGTRVLDDDRSALLGALVVAVAPTNVELSRLMAPDTFATFFVVATVVAATYVQKTGRPIAYAVTGFLVGLSASTKYNTAVVLLSLVAAHFYSNRSPRRAELLLLGGVASAIGFVLCTPFSVLDWSTFIAAIQAEGTHYSTGHPGMEGNALRWYLSYMWASAGLLYMCSAFEMIRATVARSKGLLLLSAFPIGYFIFITSFEVRNDRTLLPITPFLYLLSASLLFYLLRVATRIESSGTRRITLGIILACALVALLQPVVNTFRDTTQLVRSDSRRMARLWIEHDIPPGSHIALEAYSPFVDPERYVVQGFRIITVHPLEWYMQNGFEYLIASEGMYGRFFREPNRYPKEIAAYNDLFDRLVPVKTFPDDNFEIRIYKLADGDPATTTGRNPATAR